MTATDELRTLATRVVSWKSPDEVLANETDFLCRVMARGTRPDVNRVEALLDAERLRAALSAAPPGVLDPRSWPYWHHRL